MARKGGLLTDSLGTSMTIIDLFGWPTSFSISQNLLLSPNIHTRARSNQTPSLQEDSQSSFPASQDIMPATSLTQTNEPVFKKPKNQRVDEQWCWRTKNICFRILKQIKKSIYSTFLHDNLFNFMRNDVIYYQINNYHWI